MPAVAVAPRSYARPNGRARFHHPHSRAFLGRTAMRTFQRVAAVLVYPAIMCVGIACERDTPTEARPGRMATDAITTDRTLTGDVSTKRLTDVISVGGSATTFMTQHNGGANCSSNFPATVRFYFVSPSASGSTVGTPPAGFYTQFWWSNPEHQELNSGTQGGTIIANVGNPSEWSDWNG